MGHDKRDPFFEPEARNLRRLHVFATCSAQGLGPEISLFILGIQTNPLRVFKKAAGSGIVADIKILASLRSREHKIMANHVVSYGHRENDNNRSGNQGPDGSKNRTKRI